MAAFGVTEADHPPKNEHIEVWPDNWDAAVSFVALSTQWRSGMGGATGLDYASVISYLRERCRSRKKRALLFDAIRLMEAEALDVMRESAEQ
jgi:hypothetical protein